MAGFLTKTFDSFMKIPSMNATPTNWGPNYFTNSAAKPINLFTPAGAFGKAASGGAQSSGQSWMSKLSNFFTQPAPNDTSIMGTIKQAAPGMAISLAGNMFAPKVDTPDFSSVRSMIQNNMDSGSPFRNTAANYLTTQINKPVATPPESAFTLGDTYSDQALAKRLKDFDNMWKSVRPNVDVTNDPQYLSDRNKIIQESNSIRQQERDQQSFQYTQQQAANNLTATSQLLGLDQTQTQQLLSLAELSLEELYTKYGIDTATAMQLKELAGNMGTLVTAKRMGVM